LSCVKRTSVATEDSTDEPHEMLEAVIEELKLVSILVLNLENSSPKSAETFLALLMAQFSLC
jgi:hypothetical protein